MGKEDGSTIRFHIHETMDKHLTTMLESLLYYVEEPPQTTAIPREERLLTLADFDLARQEFEKVRITKVLGMSCEKAAEIMADGLVTFMEFGYSEADARELRRITDNMNESTKVWRLSDLDMVKLLARARDWKDDHAQPH